MSEHVITLGESTGPSLKIHDIDEGTGVSTSGGGNRSVNFGPGLEMLMNEKKVAGASGSSKSNSSKEGTDLDNLESELNALTVDVENSVIGSSSGISKPFKIDSEPIMSNNNVGDSIKLSDEPIKLNVDGIGGSDIGRTMNAETKAPGSTWDGYKRFNDIPVDPMTTTSKPALSREEEMKQKFTMLRKLDGLKAKGIKLTKEYSMESSLMEMEGEYEMQKAEKERTNSVKFQGNMMMMCVQGLEFLNKTFDPFDVDLDGWHDQVSENIGDYDEVFAELHEKYKSKATIAPELKLLFQLGGSALMVHMSNKMMSNLMPSSDDVLKQNPELMRQFMKATADTMTDKAPGFGSFMKGMMEGGPVPDNGGSGGPPPTQRPEFIPPGPTTRPDVGMSRSNPDFKDAENVDNNFGSFNKPERSERKPAQQTKRPEMKGPADIGDLLAGLKSKKVSAPAPAPAPEPTRKISLAPEDKGSTISIEELKAISKDADNVPRKGKRRPRSERNTISLEI